MLTGFWELPEAIRMCFLLLTNIMFLFLGMFFGINIMMYNFCSVTPSCSNYFRNRLSSFRGGPCCEYDDRWHYSAIRHVMLYY